MYIYIYPKPQTTKTPSRILRLFQPEKGWLRDHTFNHPFERTFSICTRNPSRWNTSRWSSRGTLASSSLIRCNWQALEFTVLGDCPEREREGRRKIILVARPGTRNLSPSPSIFLSLPRPGEMPSQPVSHDGPTGPEKWSKNFLEIDWTRLLRLSGHGWCTHHRRVVDKLSSYLRSNGHIFFFFCPR